MRFRSSNGIDMIEGKHFNWEKKNVFFDDTLGEWYRHIGFHSEGEIWACNYYEDENKLYISNSSYSSTTSISFVCDIDLAEEIVMAFVKSSKFTIQPLYDKKLVKLKKVKN